MENKPVPQATANTMFDVGQHKAPKITTKDASLSYEDKERVQNCFINYKNKISKIGNNYSPVAGEIKPNYADNHDAMKEQKVSDEREFHLLYNSLLMRKNLFLMGIKVFGSKRDFIDDDFKEAEYYISYLIKTSEYELQRGNYDAAEISMKRADDIYTAVTAVKKKTPQKKNVVNDSTKDKQTGNADTTLKSYKITVIGDDVDLVRCYKIAETALLAKDLKKAERWLLKAERIKPTDIAKQLFKKLEQAKRETTAAAPAHKEVIESTNEAKENSESDIVAINEQKAKKCQNIARKAAEDGDFEKAKRFTSKAQHLWPEVATKDMQIIRETYATVINKHEVTDSLTDINILPTKTQDEFAEKKDKFDQNVNNGRYTEFKESEIPKPKYVDSNSGTEFVYSIDDENCNRTASKSNMYKAEEYLKKGRMALTRHNIEKAESCVRKAEELFPTVRGKGLIEDIAKTKQFKTIIGSQHTDHNRVSEGPLPCNTSTQTISLDEAGKMCFHEAFKEYKRGNFDKAEECISFAAKMFSSDAVDSLSNMIKVARSKDSLKKDNNSVKNANEVQSSNSIFAAKESYIEPNLGKTEIRSLKTQCQQWIDRAKQDTIDENFDNAIKYLEKFKKLCPEKSERVNKYIQEIEHHANNYVFKEMRPERTDTINKFMQSIENHAKYHEHEHFTDLSKLEYSELLRNDKTNRNGDNIDSFGNGINTVPDTDNDKYIVTPQTLSVQKQIDEAQREYEAGNLDKSEEILTKVKELHPAAETNANKILQSIYVSREEYTHKYTKTNNKDESKACLKSKTDANRDQQSYCIKIANKAVSEGNFEKAEKLCQKAIRMNSNADVEIRHLITNIREEKEKKKEEEKDPVNKDSKEKELTEKRKNEKIKQTEKIDNKDTKITESSNNVETEMEENVKLEVEKCYEKAEFAYNEGNYDKAERLLKKSIRMAQPHHYEIADALLFKLQNERMKEQKSAIKIEKDKDIEPGEIKADQDPAVQELINKALDAVNEQHYFIAEFWLQKLQRIQLGKNTKEDTILLTKDIHSSIVASRGSTQKDEVTEKEEFKQSAAKYLALAKEKFISQDYSAARRNALISGCFVESKEAIELIEQIMKKEYEIRLERHEAPGKLKKPKSKKQGGEKDYKMFQADKYLENAEEALRFGDLEKAEEHVNKSIALHPSVKGRKMLIEIKDKLASNKGIVTCLYNKAYKGISKLKKYF